MKKINYSAVVNSLGYGVAGANLLFALEQSGAEPVLFPQGPVEYLDHHRKAVERSLARRPSFHVAGAHLCLNHEWLMAQSVGKGPRLGYTFFEIDRLPDYSVHSLNSLDVLFLPSAWAVDVVLKSGVRGPDKIVVATPGVDRTVFHPAVKPAPLMKPTNQTTVYFFAGKWCLNKNQDGLLEAFNQAFTPDDDVLLVVAAFNPLKLPNYDGPAESVKWQRLFESSPMGQAGKIRVIPGRLPTHHDVARLMAACDCGVFPARAEGFNLEAAEMLALGRHVILTNYSAHTAFAADSGARLIEVDDLEPAYDGVFFDGQAQWARFGPRQLEQTIEHLRTVHREKQSGTLKSNQQGMDLFQSKLTWENCARTILESIS